MKHLKMFENFDEPIVAGDAPTRTSGKRTEIWKYRGVLFYWIEEKKFYHVYMATAPRTDETSDFFVNEKSMVIGETMEEAKKTIDEYHMRVEVKKFNL